VRAYRRVLVDAGYHVDGATGGAEATNLLQSSEYDAIVSDISMPGVDGLELLRVVRQRDLDVPVILATAAPDMATAARAVEHGAYRYLIKPLNLTHFREIVDSAVLVCRMAKLRRRALALYGDPDKQIGDRAGLEASFGRALDTLWMAYQPIVQLEAREVYGYEALMRTTEATLPHPGAVIDAAERLGRLRDLGRAVRDKAAEGFANAPSGATLFVNLHTLDLSDDALLAPTAPLTKIASRVVLEITERASLDEVKDARARVASLRALGFRIAIDDLGAGYAGLTSFAQLEPEVVKLDMSLVRDVHKEPTKRKLVHSMTQLCREMGIVVVAEGIETPDERDALSGLGCQLLQGYLFARPGKPFPAVAW